MNRLLLIGNGFDLAHGMKTSYNDFLIWYLKKVYNRAWTNKEHGDSMLRITVRHWLPIQFGNINSIDDWIDYHYHEDGLIRLLDENYTMPGTTYNSYNNFGTTIPSKLFQKLFLNCSNHSWVEIEREYYEQLKAITKVSIDKQAVLLKSLNHTMAVLTRELNEYLLTLPQPRVITQYNTVILQGIEHDETPLITNSGYSQPEKTLALSFNYTPTIRMYGGDLIDFNFIHGQASSKSLNLVFGYGDEIDGAYANIENNPMKGLLDHIKSFSYSKNSNYHNLYRYLELADYQVCVLGHSCGLTDRTMLNMIFEHDNCKSIRIYYYNYPNGGNNYVELTQEISRHFKNKPMQRLKIVPFDKCEPMPQAIQS